MFGAKAALVVRSWATLSRPGRTAPGVPRSDPVKLTTGRPATRTIHRVIAILSHMEWLVYLLWLGATPAVVLLGRLMLDRAP